LLGAAPDARRRRMTHAEIAARLGVSARTIDRYMVKT
jgi:predicted DNA-binding transcriptional regulator YafY